MRAIDFLYEEQRLDEVAMSPGKLSALAKAIGATAGMEFEMIVPDMENPEDGEYENDYDSDERASSFSNIEDFFMGGDGNNSRSDVRYMIEKMKESFYEWYTERQYEDWSNEGLEYLKDYIHDNDDFDSAEAEETAKEEIRENNPDLPEDSDRFHEQVRLRVDELFDEFVEEEWNNNGRIYDRAYEQYIDNYDGPDEGDWLDDNYKYMTDVYNEFGSENDVYWPYQTRSGGEGELDDLADDFSRAIGRGVNASTTYHGVRNDNEYTIEPDGSLDPDDSDDTGLEFVSPPLPLDEMIGDLQRTIAWAQSRGCYTNNSTGLHMNVSVPSYSAGKLDYVKLAILLGDEYVLQQFGRQSNTYTKSAMAKVRANIGDNGERTQEFLQQMRAGLAKVASDAIHNGYTDKYTSINTKTGYIEFRSPGGNWLDEDLGKLVATLNRFVVALDAACDPEKYKNEYYKKLYKLLSAGIEESYGQMINDFAMYASGVGGAPQKVVSDFRRLALAALQASRGKETGDWWWNVTINGQRIEVVGSNPKDAWEAAIISNPPWGRLNPKEAKITRLRPFADPRPQKGNYGVWAKVPQRFARMAAQEGAQLRRFETPEQGQQWLSSTKLDPTKFEIREIPSDHQVSSEPIRATAGEPQPVGQQAQRVETYNVYDLSSGYQVASVNASSDEEALEQFNQRWPQQGYGLRIGQNTLARSGEANRRQYQIYRRDSGDPVTAFMATSDDAALQRLEQHLANVPSQAQNMYGVRRA